MADKSLAMGSQTAFSDAASTGQETIVAEDWRTGLVETHVVGRPSLRDRLRKMRDGDDPKALRDTLTQQGRDMARTETARIVAQLVQASGLSLREIERRYGFAASQVSRWSKGEAGAGAPESGAELASVKALAAALGFRVRLVLEPDT